MSQCPKATEHDAIQNALQSASIDAKKLSVSTVQLVWIQSVHWGCLVDIGGFDVR